jgi:hypothetical protein
MMITPTDEEFQDYLKALTNNYQAVYCDYKCLRNELNELAQEQEWDKSTKVEKKDAKRRK